MEIVVEKTKVTRKLRQRSRVRIITDQKQRENDARCARGIKFSFPMAKAAVKKKKKKKKKTKKRLSPAN
jgi:hypothetical protein